MDRRPYSYSQINSNYNDSSLRVDYEVIRSMKSEETMEYSTESQSVSLNEKGCVGCIDNERTIAAKATLHPL